MIKKCCCCIDLRLGVIGIGYAGVAFSVPMMCMSFLALAKREQVPNLTGHHERDMFSLYCIAYIIVLFAKLTSDILLIVSLQAQKNLAPLRLWLTVNLIMIFFTLLALSFCSSFSPTVNIVAILLIHFVCFCFLYGWASVLGLYRLNQSDNESTTNILNAIDIVDSDFGILHV